MKFFDIKRDFNTMTWVLIPVAIAINVVMGEIVVLLKLPIYLDSIGTVLVAVTCGPWAGALTGALANTIWGLLIDPNAFPWWPVAFFIGFVAGWCAIGGLFKNWWKAVIRSEEHTSELQSPTNLVCRLLLEKKKEKKDKEGVFTKESDRSLNRDNLATV